MWLNLTENNYHSCFLYDQEYILYATQNKITDEKQANVTLRTTINFSCDEVRLIIVLHSVDI